MIDGLKNMRLAVWHVVALLVMAMWGGSFISTKILLHAGFLSTQIFILRFALAYVVLLIFYHKKLFSDSILDELRLLICGITAGSLYFIVENKALEYSFASNVSLIICMNPLLLMLVAGLIYKSERLNRRQILGSFVTFLGMILVVLNGKFILKLSPVGDLLALWAAISWIVYSLVVRPLMTRYTSFFITRKILFYGIVTGLPVFFIFSPDVPWMAFADPVVLGNYLFLALIASLLCYVLWNKVMHSIGMVLASNYVYTNPLFTILIAAIVLRERITIIAFFGAALILLGMLLAEYKKR
ncbi:MAG: DMT family transporter [Fibrobacter sp.]|nr:DMT family transporter [Fibrobacter sp.]